MGEIISAVTPMTRQRQAAGVWWANSFAPSGGGSSDGARRVGGEVRAEGMLGETLSRPKAEGVCASEQNEGTCGFDLARRSWATIWMSRTSWGDVKTEGERGQEKAK
jgi:hypothetical protein